MGCAGVVIGPAGKDQGKGGKYLMLPSGYRSDVPVDYFAVLLQTYGGFWLTRTIPKTGPKVRVSCLRSSVRSFLLVPVQACTGNMRARAGTSSAPRPRMSNVIAFR